MSKPVITEINIMPKYNYFEMIVIFFSIPDESSGENPGAPCLIIANMHDIKEIIKETKEKVIHLRLFKYSMIKISVEGIPPAEIWYF